MMRRPFTWRSHCFVGAALLLPIILAVWMTATLARPSPVSASIQDQNPDAVCRSCHRKIFDRYERTRKALGSGPAQSGFLPGVFFHKSSNVAYKVFERDGAVRMSFERRAAAANAPLQGEENLEYFVGSGERGRTFLYRIGDRWFELPINYYGRRKAWGMAPRYDDVAQMPNALPVDVNCLHCHATGVAASAAEARNRLGAAPWSQNGIGCGACHGDPSKHLQQHGLGAIVNPAKLAPPRRDSACIQCHLEGDAVVYRNGREIAQFKPGDDLNDFAVYFVRSSQLAGGARATSQYEALLQSACKRASGDRLACTSCHDPHSTPAPEERIGYYRTRCLACHASPAMAASHHPEQPDCAACHMSQRDTADISHEQVTDHNIERVPPKPAKSQAQGDSLAPVGGFTAGDRELGLAYAQLAGRGDAKAGNAALNLLRSAGRAESAGKPDEQLHLNLGFLEQKAGNMPAARKDYEAALAVDPYAPAALSNLAVLYASSGETTRAARLLDRLVTDDPGQTEAGLNLIRILCASGNTDAAKAVLKNLLPFALDDPRLRQAIGGENCGSAGR